MVSFVMLSSFSGFGMGREARGATGDGQNAIIEEHLPYGQQTLTSIVRHQFKIDIFNLLCHQEDIILYPLGAKVNHSCLE
jgi:hypothetical protein